VPAGSRGLENRVKAALGGAERAFMEKESLDEGHGFSRAIRAVTDDGFSR
jgi:hypothetical protein